MSAYVIFNYAILDRSQIEELTRRSIVVDTKYGAEVIVGSPAKVLEGNVLSHMVIYRFMSIDQAKSWYYSEENQSLSVFRQGITKGWAAMVAGVDEMEEFVASEMGC